MKEQEKNNPTPSELAILQVLWQKGSATVREVHDQLSSEKEVVYTTILKTMQLMVDRGMLKRTAKGRKHIYAPVVEEGETQDKLSDKFLNRTFGGSASKMVLRALGNYDATNEEIDEIKKILESNKKKK